MQINLMNQYSTTRLYYKLNVLNVMLKAFWLMTFALFLLTMNLNNVWNISNMSSIKKHTVFNVPIINILFKMIVLFYLDIDLTCLSCP